MMARLAGWLLGLLAVASGFAALLLGVVFVHLVRMPFNAQGRHFDEGVVHHAQAVPIYGLLLLLFSAAALLFLWLSRRWLRLGRTAGGHGGPSVRDGIAGGERAITENRVATQGEAKTRLARWLE